MKLAFFASENAEAQQAKIKLESLYTSNQPEDADIIVVLGGDGFMLKALHRFQALEKPVYGMNFGSIGFLMNPYLEDNLPERLNLANETVLHPLKMETIDCYGKKSEALAINEVSLLRQTAQAAKIAIYVDNILRLEQLICDGILIATPAGSTAYNLSAHGPIIPINANLLALTPISAFRPRRWRGALLPDNAHVTIKILEADKRPVSASADDGEVRNVSQVDVHQDLTRLYCLLFDPDHNLEERILGEQFYA
jgi:NAD+ kinase